MAAKFVLLLTFVTAVVGADINCDCNSDDNKELWEYLTKISLDFDDLTEEEKEMYSVLPGFLSPLFECNCLSDRKKRSITPKVRPLEILSTSLDAEKKENPTPKPTRLGHKIRYRTRSCPVGYVRIVYWCVPEEKIE
ncbi:unnamed protein product [Arctia plantaginis]|uniref:Uncharacterized protein n=1 Tax=Arctia plantaginis TaxID=874455 RepID=A0A8S1B6E5_ARCPL|nr:unnamed protein product [Arctia plantaginis]